MQRSRILGVSAAVLIAVFALAGCKRVSLPRQQPAATRPATVNTNQNSASMTAENKILAEAKVLVFASQNNSGEAGNAKIIEVDGKAKVVFYMTGAPQDVAQPAHIHEGTCAKPGAVKYPLISVVNGASKTTLEVSPDVLKSELPLIINVHKSKAEIGTYVACVDIPSDFYGGVMEKKTDEAAMKKNENTNTSATSAVKSFTVVEKNFTVVPNQIKVKKGDMVKITLQDDEGFHDLKIDEFSVASQKLNAGQGTQVQFIADKTGTFEYYCSIGQHRQFGMTGKLIVE